jgi:sugar/nucleoside kinase (ribokinase family)
MADPPERSEPDKAAGSDERGDRDGRPGRRAPRRGDVRGEGPPPPARRKKERDPSLPPWRRRPRARRESPGGEPARAPLEPGRRLSVVQTSRTPQYLVIGHICADLQDDGTVVLGGTALYSALTAARLGWRVGVLTRGAFGGRIAGMDVPSLEQFAGEISIVCQDAEVPTTFINVYTAGRREQTMPHWAGPIDLRGLPPHWRNARVIHLGPVAQEIDQKQTGSLTPQFLGITPQGWMREWPRETGGKVRLGHLRIAPELLARTDGMIVSIEEIALAREVVERVGAHRLGVITKGESGARIIYGGETIDLPGFNVPTVDLTGAGDVFAAAFFIRAADRNASALTAGRFGNAAAALSLRGVGPAGVPSLREVEDLLAAADERVARPVARR